MKAITTTKKMTYAGAGAGLFFVVVVGLLLGSLLGGMVGLNIADGLLSFPVASAIIPRLMVGMSILLGVVMSGLLFITGCSSLGWLVGHAVDSP